MYCLTLVWGGRAYSRCRFGLPEFTAGISTIVVWPPGLTDGIGTGALSLPSSQ